jgi:hypothetical protein
MCKPLNHDKEYSRLVAAQTYSERQRSKELRQAREFKERQKLLAMHHPTCKLTIGREYHSARHFLDTMIGGNK